MDEFQFEDDDDYIDAEDHLDFAADPVDDNHITNVALFASVNSEKEAKERAKEWKELFNGS